MVHFTTMPYHMALERSAKQDRIVAGTVWLLASGAAAGGAWAVAHFFGSAIASAATSALTSLNGGVAPKVPRLTWARL